MAVENKPSSLLILVLTTVTSFMTAFMGSSLNIALPVIGETFGSSGLLLSWISTIYILTTAALLIPIGSFSDISGRIKYFKVGVILFTTGSLLCGIAPDTTFLLVTRVVQGIGSAFIFSTSTAILVSAYPQSERGKALGINIASVYFGLSSGPFFGGLITHYWTWRGIFYINAIFGILISLVVLYRFRGELEEYTKKPYDFSGSIVYVLSIILMMLGLSLLPSFAGAVILITGSVALVLFYVIEKRKAHPAFDVSLLGKNKTFTYSNVAALINYSATFAVGFLMSFFLQTVKGLSPEKAGIILITQPALQSLFSPLAGRISDKHEPQVVSSIGMSILTAGLIVFCFLGKEFSLILITANLGFLGIGFALFSSPNVNAVMSSVEKRYYGVASSSLASMRMIGQMFSMGIVIVIFNIFIGSKQISPENQASFILSSKTAFILFSVLSFMGIFASLSRGKIHKNL